MNVLRAAPPVWMPTPALARILALIVLALSLSACGQKEQAASGPAAYLPVVPPQAVESPAGRIEVIEFFSYACIHCYRLNSLAKAWASAQPPDVAFRRIPVSFDRPQLVPLARLFYALEATGQLAAHDDAIFAALHDRNESLMTDEAVLAWVAGRGIDMANFRAAWDSPDTRAKLEQAAALTRAYKVSGTPAIYAAGRWMVNLEAAQGYEDLMDRTGKLVDKIRRGEKP